MQSQAAGSGPCRACDQPGAPDRQSMTITSLSEMDKAAGSGCVSCGILCRVIHESLLNDESISPEAQQNVDRLRIDSNMTASGKSLELFLFGLETRISLFHLENSPALEKTMQCLSTGSLIPCSTASEESLEWVKKNMERCDKLHYSCSARRQTAVTGIRPTRILDVGSDDGSTIRLCKTPDAFTEYACLSHCWGTDGLLRTLSANLSQHLAGIVWTDLPLTYQETISFVRRLGIRYLWIDSLCIIQDDADDWAREAANMATVYRNARLVISASKSSSATGGLYAQPHRRFHARNIYMSSDEVGSPALWFRQSLAHIPSFVDRRLATPVSFPTFNRAWIAQERYLAPRVLHFGPQELFWECFEDRRCQCTPEEDGIHHGIGDDIKSRPNSRFDRVSRPKAYYSESNWAHLGEAELVACWHRLVEDYSKLDMTFSDDVFPAMSGIAKTFQCFKKSVYHAGLWETSLVADMAWHAVTDDTDGTNRWARRVQPWRAPSWSWASLQCPVAFINESGELRSLCEVIEVGTTLAGLDYTGAINQGHAVLKGHVLPTKLNYHTHPDGKLFSWNLLDVECVKGKVCNVWADYDMFIAGDNCISPNDVVYALLLAEKIVSGALVILLLKQTSEGDQHQDSACERFGIVELPRPPALRGSGRALWREMCGTDVEWDVCIKIV